MQKELTKCEDVNRSAFLDLHRQIRKGSPDEEEEDAINGKQT